MADSLAAPGAASRFFGNYLTCPAKASVPERQRRWYVKRVEDFITAQQGRRIKSLSGTEVTEYLARIGRESRLGGGVAIPPVRRRDKVPLLRAFASPVCRQGAWDYWHDSAREPEADHPSNGRHLTPEELTHRKERRGEVHISQWAQRLRARRGFHKATVALAAKHTRILLAMLARGVDYRPDTKPTAAEPTTA